MGGLSQRIVQMSPLKLAFAAMQLESQRELMNAEPVAIIGAGCRFPGGADSPESFWRLLEKGTDAVTEVPSDRWNIDDYYDPDPDAPGKMYSRHGAFLDHVDLFDPAFFGITPREAVSMDPQQRLLLEVSWEALENSGRLPDQLFGTPTGVFIGISTFDYAALRLAQRARDRIDAYFISGSVLSVAAGRLSYLLGLTGPSMSVDTACSSSLVAVHLACQSLRNRECSLALAGGVGLILAPEPSINFSRARMLAPDGRCKTFDASADGYVRGEGCGIIVLKRLSDAIADGDSVVALVRGSAVNQDGPSGGLTVPSGPSQERVMRSALASGGVLPEQVSYIEAHGTGTTLGDPIEVGSVGNVFGSRSWDNPLLIGSVKTNIGHLEAAAGIAGIIKVIVSLEHRAIPPHLHFRDPNPHIQWSKFPLVVPTEMREWPLSAGRRIAGVSSFGFSGTNAHVVIEEAQKKEETSSEYGAMPRPLTHTFNRQRYWIETDNADERCSAVASIPLLGRRLRLPFSSEIRFEMMFSHARPAYIEDHKLFGTTVAAGASHLALLLQAAKETFAADACVIEEVHFLEALVIPEARSRIVQIVLTPEAADSYAFSLVSGAEGEEGDGLWSQHVTGRIMPLADSKPVLTNNVTERLNVVRHQWQTMPAFEFYTSIEEAGHHLGTSFKWVEAVYFDKREAFCIMRSAGLQDSADDYQLYPGLIDSCFQFFCIHGPQFVIGDSFSNPAGFEIGHGVIYIPFSIDSVRFYGPPARNAVLWCHTYVRENERQDNSITGDLQLIDETGRIFADINGFTARRLDREVLLRGTGSGGVEWLYESVWQRQALQERVSERVEQGSWVIFADRGGVGAGLAALLEGHGQQCRVAYSNEADITGNGAFQELFSGNTVCRGVVHMWGLDAGGEITAASLERSQDLGSVSAAQIVQALIKQGFAERPRLWLVTRGAQPVESSASQSGLQQSPVWGLGKVLGLEHPELKTVCVDLDPCGKAGEAERLFVEVWSPDGEDQIAYSQGERYAARLVRYKRKGGKRFEVSGDCSYLVTGGFGALGLRIAEWLVEKGARNLVLSGRKGVSEEGQARIK
ncbi:MAG: beta-ketoacyl synthase N-terminal-like domain-containing protein, partial [Dissulfurispiraceae bacterium]